MSVFILVNCRVGSLENSSVAVDSTVIVNCRVGSLEILKQNSRKKLFHFSKRLLSQLYKTSD